MAMPAFLCERERKTFNAMHEVRINSDVEDDCM